MNKINCFNESLRDLANAKRILREAYGDTMGDNEQDPRMIQQDPRMAQQGQDMVQGQPMGESEEENPIEDPQMNDIIDQIRQLAIKGIAQYADQVDSEKYQSLKKIWLLTDKFYEDAMNEENNNKKF